MRRFLEEVPALAPLKLVAGLELHGRHDIQLYRVEMPGPNVTKEIAADAKITLTRSRAQFNELATAGHVADWGEAFEHREVKATGIEQVIKLIVNVVERQQERSRTRRAAQRRSPGAARESRRAPRPLSCASTNPRPESQNPGSDRSISTIARAPRGYATACGQQLEVAGGERPPSSV